ncbi:MAG: aspartate aminotransferase family protein [Desulfuromonadales bacterium]|nr:aspartate aminotransferase family protein [Desulfuromonadales bacterium]
MNSQVVARSNSVFTPAFHTYHSIAIQRGEGCQILDQDGKSYLDCASGLAVLNIGHNHPRVMERVSQQMANFVHTGGVFLNEVTVEAAELLTTITPTGMDMLFFSNSGAEAVEGAIKLARHVTGRQGIIAFSGAFHGRTLGALSLTSSNCRYRERYPPLLPSVYHAPYPFCHHCLFGCRTSNCTLTCLNYLEDMLRHSITPTEVAAIIIEPILGEGGYSPAPSPFLTGLRQLCDKYGILLIFDEVQSGMGRSGEWFAAQGYDVTPDILTVAKGIASGFPLSAVVSRRELMEKWPTWAHGTTFGGNPVSCAAAIATMETIRDRHLLPRCRQLGNTTMERLRALQKQHPLISDVRGRGLMIGIELTQPDGTPASAACDRILHECLEHGLIIINCGAERNIIRFIPPLTISDVELDQALRIMGEALESVL